MRYLQLAVKNVTREKKRSLLLAGAIAFGLSVILLTGSLADGIMESFVQQQAGMISGHVVVKGLGYSSRDSLISHMEDGDLISTYSDEFFTEGLSSMKRSTQMGSFVNGSEARQQFIMGIDPEREEKLQEMLILKEGTFLQESSSNGILLTEDIADDLNLGTGDRVMLKIRTLQGINNVGDFYVQGIIAGDLGTVSEMASFVQRKDLNRILNIPDEDYTELHLFLDDPSDTEGAAAEFHSFLETKGLAMVERPTDSQARQEILARLTSQDWSGLRYQISSLEETFPFVYVIGMFLNATAFLVMAVLVSIILVGISNTLRMMIFERRKEIGTLRALGMQKGSVVNTFIAEMQLITWLGVLMGFLMTLVLGKLIGSFVFDADHSFISLFLYRNRITLSFMPNRFLLNGGLILFLVWLGSLIPAGKAAKLDPAKAIHSIA